MNHSAGFRTGFFYLFLLSVVACNPETRTRTSFNPPPNREVLPVRTTPPIEPLKFPPPGPVDGSKRCVDCESIYYVHDGKGGRLRRSNGETTDCCPCGSTQKFRDGNRYQIRCENGRIIARML